MSNYSSQPTLFDIHPIGTELPVAQRVITPGCLLPLPEKKIIDINRVRAILGVNHHLAVRLRAEGHISGFRMTENSVLKIEYASLVEFCDQLRIDYHIADRRKSPARDGRWRDAELLPFPLADTVDTSHAMRGFNMTRIGVLRLCEEGRFDCYRLLPIASVPWRISKTSLFAYFDRLNAQLNRRPMR